VRERVGSVQSNFRVRNSKKKKTRAFYHRRR